MLLFSNQRRDAMGFDGLGEQRVGDAAPRLRRRQPARRDRVLEDAQHATQPAPGAGQRRQGRPGRSLFRLLTEFHLGSLNFI